jgi:hypothetical protein
MAINTFCNVTLNTGTGATQSSSAVLSNASGANVCVSYDNAVITTQAQLRTCITAALLQMLGQLTGP